MTNVTFCLLLSVLRSSGELLFSFMGKWMKILARAMVASAMLPPMDRPIDQYS